MPAFLFAHQQITRYNKRKRLFFNTLQCLSVCVICCYMFVVCCYLLFFLIMEYLKMDEFWQQ